MDASHVLQIIAPESSERPRKGGSTPTAIADVTKRVEAYICTGCLDWCHECTVGMYRGKEGEVDDRQKCSQRRCKEEELPAPAGNVGDSARMYNGNIFKMVTLDTNLILIGVESNIVALRWLVRHCEKKWVSRRRRGYSAGPGKLCRIRIKQTGVICHGSYKIEVGFHQVQKNLTVMSARSAQGSRILRRCTRYQIDPSRSGCSEQRPTPR